MHRKHMPNFLLRFRWQNNTIKWNLFFEKLNVQFLIYARLDEMRLIGLARWGSIVNFHFGWVFLAGIAKFKGFLNYEKTFPYIVLINGICYRKHANSDLPRPLEMCLHFDLQNQNLRNNNPPTQKAFQPTAKISAVYTFRYFHFSVFLFSAALFVWYSLVVFVFSACFNM